MTTGRKPLATAVHRLNGNPGNRALPKNEPPGVGSVGPAPAWFDKEQRAEWAQALANAPIHVLTGTDRQLLTIYCVAVIEHRNAAKDVRKRGQLVQGVEKVPVVNASIRIMNQSATVLLKAMAEMGFSPSSRTRLEIAPGTGSGNDFAEFASVNDAEPEHKKTAH